MPMTDMQFLLMMAVLLGGLAMLLHVASSR